MLVFWWLTVNVLIPQYSALQKQTSPWQRDVVQSLRVVRQKLKSGSYPVQIDKGEALRLSVKAAELSAEKIQLNMMEDATAQVPPSDIPPNLSNLTAVLTMVVDAQSKIALTSEHMKNIQLIANEFLTERLRELSAIQPAMLMCLGLRVQSTVSYGTPSNMISNESRFEWFAGLDQAWFQVLSPMTDSDLEIRPFSK